MEKVLTKAAVRKYSPKADVTFLRSPVFSALAGFCTLLAAVPVAILIHTVQGIFPDQTEKAILGVGVLFGGLLLLPPAGYLLVRRRLSQVGVLALLLLSTVTVLLAGIYLYQTSFLVAFPADILSWSESDFVNDILKFRTGYPLYSNQANNDSFVYPPGPQILTYFLASLLGKSNSIPVFRGVQVFFALLAAGTAYFSALKLLALGSPSKEKRTLPIIWSMLWVPLLFLIATNSLTNLFIHNLHDDALALFVSSLAYLLLISYVEHRKPSTLALMVVVPAAGFWVKQSLVIWAVIYCVHLLVFDRPRSIPRVAAFGLAAAASIGLSVGFGYVLWGNNFIYWTFTVLGAHGISPLRSFQHLLDVWPYLTIGLLGGIMLLRGRGFSTLLGPWVTWLALILVQIYTSGVAWMINHIGPGSLIAGIWFAAGLARGWPAFSRSIFKRPRLIAWLRAGIAAALIALLFQGLGIIRIPLQPISQDSYRYIVQIEQEFSGLPAGQVLLDAGSWVYVQDQVIMKDRAPTIGERGWSQTADFSGILERIKEQSYAKILVRNLHQPNFWYDYESWEVSSGIRAALLENYYEARQIPAAEGQDWYLFHEVSVLLPR